MFEIKKSRNAAGNSMPAEVDADYVKEEGHEGRWLVFYTTDATEVARIRSSEVFAVERKSAD